MGLFDSVLGGAVSGTAAAPGIGTAIGAGAALLPSVFKLFSGRSQIKKANAINPVNPGFQANTSLIDNARILESKYRNYQLPGYQQAKDNINQSSAQAFASGVQGATSSGDVLDLASKINYGTGQSLNQLAGQNAQGADQALNNYLSANSMAGNELVRKNMFDMDQYNQKLQEKAALLQAGNQNQYTAGDSIADGIRYFTQPQQQLIQPGTTGKANVLPSIFNPIKSVM